MRRKTRFFTVAIVGELSLAAAAMLVGPWFSIDVAGEICRPLRLQINDGPQPSTLAVTKFTVTVIVACLPLLVGLMIVIRSKLPGCVRLKKIVTEQFVPILLPLPAWSLVLIGMAAGFGEEVLFRGLIQSVLDNYLWTPWLAIGLAAALFGLLHWITPTYGLLAAIAGAYLGWLYHWTGNLWLAINVHAMYDVIALLWLIHGLPQQKNGPAK